MICSEADLRMGVDGFRGFFEGCACCINHFERQRGHGPSSGLAGKTFEEACPVLDLECEKQVAVSLCVSPSISTGRDLTVTACEEGKNSIL